MSLHQDRPQMGADDPRLAQAVELRRQDPRRSVQSIARHLRADVNRIRVALLEAGVMKPRFASDVEDADTATANAQHTMRHLDRLLDAHGERWPADDDVGEHVLGRPVLVRTELGRLGARP